MSFSRTTILAALLVAGFYVVLIASLLHFLVPGAFLESRTFLAVGVSLGAATLATLLALPLAVPAAYAFSRLSFPGKGVAEAFLEFPLIVSPSALGALLLMFFHQGLGAWIQDHTTQFVFAFWGVVLAQFATVLGLAVRFIKAAMDEVPSRYESMARSLGARPFQAFRTTTFPLARRGILAAFVLAWAKAMGEFGATITLAGTLPGRTETLPVAIYMRLSSADLGGAAALILVLTLFGVLTLALVRRLAGGAFHA